jgi:two-component system sensor histidine kinase ChvG
MTIVKPLRRLRRQAAAAAERRGPLPMSFPGSNRKDELGDLARAMEVLTRRLNEQIGQLEGFTADVAHEFRNPLASIRTAAEMAGQSERAEDRERFLGLMMRDVDRLERLVSGAREMARIDGELEQSGQQAAPLADLLRDAIDRLGPIAHNRIDLDSLPTDVVIRGSPERLSQVFENLLANALSLAPPETRIKVAAGVDGQQCSVRIADRGPGIPEAHLDRIFERFFTYRPESGRQEHLGLGLAIARRIVESHGGTLTARNREGGGSEFAVRLGYSARSAVSASTFSARRDGR